MARTRYASDPGLIARMGATMFLLGLVFAGFATGLVYLIAYYSSHRHGGSGAMANADVLIFFAAVIGIGSALGSYYWSDKIALRTSGARLVSPNDGPDAARLHGIVDRLCALADMPKPRIAIAPTQMPNAFATGRNSKVAVLCATQGILDRSRLTDEELEGVLAHEMSHVAHKDVAVMTIASFLGIIAALMVRFAFYSELFGGRGRSNNNQSALLVIPIMLAEHRRVRRQLPADQAAVAVPRAVRRPVWRAADRAAVGAGQRPGEGDRRHGPDPREGPARSRAAERVLLRPGAAGPARTWPRSSPRTRR